MAHNKYEYVDIEDNPNFKSLRIANIKGFIKLLQQFQAKIVLRTEKPNIDNKQINEFIFLENQILYRLDSNNFKSLEDYEDAANRDFPDAESFYEAQQASIGTYKEYQDIKKTGIVDKQQYVKAQKHGFFDAYDKFKDRCENNKTLIPKNFNPAEYNTPILLCEFALSKGFKDYWDFEKAFFFGFTDKITFDEAKTKGYTYA
ncbi:MAG: hypothetical protein WCH34_17205, partial [Bacteroidota bacterium]